MTALALAIAVVMLALMIPRAVAQSSRKLPPGLASARVAINEGRYDEVPTLTAQLDGQDPAVVAVRARAMIERGRYDEAITGAAAGGRSRPGERRGARARPAAADAQPRRSDAILERVAARAGATDDPQQVPAAGTGAARARPVPGSERGVSRRGHRGAARSRDQTGLG